MKPSAAPIAKLFIVQAGLLALLFGCEGPRTARPTPVTPAPASEYPPSATTGPSKPSSQPTAPIRVWITPRDDEPELPDYIRVLERFRPGEAADVQVQITSPTRLVIRTRNVRRLWIDRDRLPMNTRQSLVLQLDGQGIEWTAQSAVREFERSINGDWTGTKP